MFEILKSEPFDGVQPCPHEGCTAQAEVRVHVRVTGPDGKLYVMTNEICLAHMAAMKKAGPPDDVQWDDRVV